MEKLLKAFFSITFDEFLYFLFVHCSLQGYITSEFLYRIYVDIDTLYTGWAKSRFIVIKYFETGVKNATMLVENILST